MLVDIATISTLSEAMRQGTLLAQYKKEWQKWEQQWPDQIVFDPGCPGSPHCPHNHEPEPPLIATRDRSAPGVLYRIPMPL